MNIFKPPQENRLYSSISKLYITSKVNNILHHRNIITGD